MRKMRLVAGLCAWLPAFSAAVHASLARASVSSVGPFFFHALAPPGSDAASVSLGSVLSPDELAAPVVDRDWVWQRYHGHLMSPKRANPFVVVFTDDRDDCAALGDEEDEATHVAEEEILACQQRSNHTQQVTAWLTAVVAAKGFPSSLVLPIVHITASQLPQALALHRVPSTPSLQWFPPRSTSKFQRHAHHQTNFLDLSTASSAEAVVEALHSFLARSYRLSSLPFPTPNARPPPPEPVLEDTMVAKILNMLPFMAIGIYITLAAYEYRTQLLKVLRYRFTWLVLTQFVLYVSFSGLFYSIIHRVAPFYAHPHFGFYLIHPSGRKQFFIEGLLNGSWSFVISFALFSIVNVMPKVRSAYAREEIFRMSLIAVGVAYGCVHVVFMSKHPWLSR